MAKNKQPNNFKPLPLSEDYREAGIEFDPSQVSPKGKKEVVEEEKVEEGEE